MVVPLVYGSFRAFFSLGRFRSSSLDGMVLWLLWYGTNSSVGDVRGKGEERKPWMREKVRRK